MSWIYETSWKCTPSSRSRVFK